MYKEYVLNEKANIDDFTSNGFNRRKINDKEILGYLKTLREDVELFIEVNIENDILVLKEDGILVWDDEIGRPCYGFYNKVKTDFMNVVYNNYNKIMNEFEEKGLFKEKTEEKQLVKKNIRG